MPITKRALSRAVASVAPGASPGGVRVLMYHAIDEPDPGDPLSLRVSRTRFLEQMTLLRDEQWNVVPLATVFNTSPANHLTRVAITFDDGYQSQAWAATVLRKFGFPATFFVVPRFLDGVQAATAYWETWGHLNWDAVGALLDNGFDVGAHSATHPDLRKCPSGQLEEEVSGARVLLEQRLGRAIDSFSYPYGRHDRRVREAVERAGYRVACTSQYGLNRASASPFAVHRTEVTGTDDLEVFGLKLRGKYDWLGYWQALRPTS